MSEAIETPGIVLLGFTPGDADQIRTLLFGLPDERYPIEEVESLQEAAEVIRLGEIGAILLDVSQPDCPGVATLKSVRAIAGETPIIVLTETEDDLLGAAYIRGGAADYLARQKLDRLGLRRAIGFVIGRLREKQLRAIRMSLEARQREDLMIELRQYQELASQTLHRAISVLKNRVAERTRELEDANRQLREEIAERQRAQQVLSDTQKLQATGQLAGGVAHHFNNMLTVVLGGTQILLNRSTDPKAQRQLTVIADAAQRGARLTRQLLSFAREQMVQPETFAPSERLTSIAMLFTSSLQNGIRVNTDIPGDLWPIKVDVSEMELAALNIAFNARDAMPNGGELSLSAANVELNDLRLGLHGRFVAIEISDQGTGIGPDVLPRIFEPFFTTKEVGVGSGLGLSQVHGFAHQAGGAVDVATNVEQGTTVRLYLPAVVAAIETPPEVEPPLRRWGEGRTIFVLDDDVSVAAVCAEMLEQQGFRVVVFHSSSDTLEALRHYPRVDLLCSDAVIPGDINGIDLAMTIRSEHPELPVLLISGQGALIENAMEHNLPVLAKPYSMTELCDQVQRLLMARVR